MATPRYLWRQLNEKQREELLECESSAAIRGIPRRTGQTSNICDFSFRQRVLNIIITSATAGNVWIIFARPAGCVCGVRGRDVCVVRVAESLSRAGRSARHKTFAARVGFASRPHFARLEWRRADMRAESFLPRGRARDAFRSALLGDAELYSSQSGAAWLRRMLDRLAMGEARRNIWHKRV